MRAAIVIPARFASTRFPGKPLAALIGAGGAAKPLIQRTWEVACAVPNIDMVVIATDDEAIAAAARGFGAQAVLTPASCLNGTERCAAVAATLDPAIDIVVNLQGDAPLTPAFVVTALVEAIATTPTISVTTPAITATAETYRRLQDDARDGRVGGTTVVAADNDDALYFSKSVIPYVGSDREANVAIQMHLGVYAYTRAALFDYAARGPCRLEMLEGLEQLRFIVAGIAVRLVPVDVGNVDLWELNNPGDVPLIEAALAARGIA